MTKEVQKCIGRWMVYSSVVAVALCLGAATAYGLPGDLEAELVVDELEFPIKMEPIGPRDLLVTEKMGALRLVRDGELVDEPLLQFDVKPQNEAGLLDVATAPDFDESGEFFIVYTPQQALDSMYISRLRLDGDSAQILDDPWIELPSIPETDRHFGGTIDFSPDGDLYVSIGDLRQVHRSQDLDDPAGSILRYGRDGTVASTNPFGEENPIFAYGLRNPFGIAFDGEGNLWNVENSDDVNDELNLIREGLNYGWPLVEGRCDNFPDHEPCEDADELEDPVYEFRTVTGPTAVVRYEDELIEAFDGDLMVTGWHSGAVHHLEWNEETGRAEKKGILFRAPTTGAGLTDIAIADDGAIFVQESGPSGGAIYRIAPRTKLWDDGAVVGEGGSGCSSPAGRTPPVSGWVLALAVLVALSTIRRTSHGATAF